MKFSLLIQARSESKRFPNKVLKKIGASSVISFMNERLLMAKNKFEIIYLLPHSEKNSNLENEIIRFGGKIFFGEEENVYKRYYDCAKKLDSDALIRLTSDCPFIDFSILDQMIDEYCQNPVHYFSNTLISDFPDGFDVEIFNRIKFLETINLDLTDSEKEHVTMLFKNRENFEKENFKDREFNGKYSNLRLTVDYIDDLKLLRNIFKHFQNKTFTFPEIVELYEMNKDLFKINSSHARDEGSKMNNKDKIWNRAVNSIAGGNLLLSKNPHQFHDEWPTYYKSAEGVEIISCDNKKYIDMGMMGIGTNTLGYNHKEINEEVIKAISKSNLTTLNCPEEVELAEKLLSINTWANKCRFTRSGGEANAVAIRIARAATGKDKVLICGYHGWHDWYLSLNLDEGDKLAGNLLPNLKIKGVPENLAGSTLAFKYNDLDEFMTLLDEHKDIGAVKMEVMRNNPPKRNFLESIRNECSKRGIVLIFDECTSGFRETFGGLHKKFDVEPDMAIFGKTLGNGFAINAILGKDVLMDSIQETFISSTFWTERIGNVAALKTLEIMEREKSWEYITSYGKKVKEMWAIASEKYNVKIKILGIDALATFVFENNHKILQRLHCQNMLDEGILASTQTYSSTKHNDEHLQIYKESFEKSFKMISELKSSQEIIDRIRGGENKHIELNRFN